MKHHKPRTVAALSLLLITTVAAVGYIADRRRRVVTDPGKMPVASQPVAPQVSRGRPGARPKNLSLQPEALAVARQLGNRFSADKNAQSVIVGTLTIGAETKVVRTIRTQTDDGEQIEINPAGRGGALTWDSTRGALSGAARANSSDRELVERLVLDSPDQFVLAQLRGASYFTVARNVRPPDAGENYRGPLWNIVRVSDPDADESKAAQSRWRLYYIDSATGLIQRIESDRNGRRIIAELSGWTDQSGQKLATEITWKQDGQTVMQYRVTSFTHVTK